jgi:vanillate O-demethylase monooxygenase subunit
MGFLKNAWYVGASVTEVRERPLGRVILGVPVVFYRGEDGSHGALLDVCPHRAVPLHLGKVAGDRLQCGYHALEFDRAGICRHNPHVAGPSHRLTVRAFPLVERYGLLWIWPGEPQAADPGAIPTYEQFEQPGQYAVGAGYTHVAAEYRLMLDNLFDLCHAEYLHAHSVGVVGASKVAQYEVERAQGSVKYHYNIPNMPPAVLWRSSWNKSERVDQHAYMHWTGAGNVYLSLCITPTGSAPSEGWNMPWLHLLTPETQSSTHYFWLFARDFALDKPGLTQAIAALGAKAFEEEDKPMLEWAQRSITTTGAKLLNMTSGDAASAHIRRMIEQQLEQEA